jgi:hypothetical protein
LKVAGHRQQAHQQERGRERRQGDEAQLLRGRGAVDARGLIQIAGDRLQRREKDHHVVAEVLPHREQGNGRHGPVRIAEPVDARQADQAERVVDHAVAGVQQAHPDHGHGDQRGHDRREQRRAKHLGPARQARMQEQRGAERGSDRGRHAGDDEERRVGERAPEQRRVEQARIVAQPDEA